MTKWTLEEVRKSMEKFVLENGHQPSAREFDKCPYLPTAKLIQRNFGGLPKLRRLLTPESPSNFTTGVIRSDIARRAKIRSYESEERFYYFLTSKFPEVRVHEQKRLRPGNIASDFFIYTDESRGFAIDVFFSSDRFNTIGILNIKTKRYAGLKIPIVFIVMGNFLQEDMDSLNKSKKNPLEKGRYLYTEKYFMENISSIINQILLT